MYLSLKEADVKGIIMHCFCDYSVKAQGFQKLLFIYSRFSPETEEV